ncbi:MAG: prohibitin family protein [Ruminiclostridium sp.]|nr:prohibitin family protein [Ruminiclostridium sp.]
MAEMRFSTNGKQSGSTGSIDGKKTGVFVLIGALVILALIVLFNCFSIVNEGFIGVKYTFGKITQDNLTPGLNFCIPFVEEIRQVDVREQIYAVEADAYTSDTQTVQELRMKLNYRYDRSKLSDLIKNIGIDNVETKLLVQNVAKISKNEIGKVKAEELVQSRHEVQQIIENKLKEILIDDGIIVESFAIENLSFDDAFEASIQAKVIAAQDALKMENKTKEKEEEAKQIVIAAQAEAESKKLQADANAYAIQKVQEQLANSPNYIDYLKITNWNGELPQIIGDGVNPFVSLETNKTDSNTNAQ